jgi:cyclophilin family peptidyl-prolyl cis-trans isomerase
MRKLPFWFKILLLLVPAAAHAQEAPRVEMQTSQGTIVLELYQDKAPKTVDNFLQYVQDGFYNNTIFHRVINDFMIQGGGFTPEFEHKQTRPPIINEADNGLENKPGTIAMARTGEPHSATAQFFINVADNDFLNHTNNTPRGWGYAVFGKVIKGMDVVNKIKSLPTGPGGPFPSDVPTVPVIIQQVTLLNPSQPSSSN